MFEQQHLAHLLAAKYSLSEIEAQGITNRIFALANAEDMEKKVFLIGMIEGCLLMLGIQNRIDKCATQEIMDALTPIIGAKTKESAVHILQQYISDLSNQ